MLEFNLRAKMPFAPFLAMPLDKGVDSFRQSTNDPHDDFFDQYLSFDAVDADAAVHLSAPESTHLVSSIKGSDSADTLTKWWKDVAGQNLAPGSQGEQLQNESAASLHDRSVGNIVHLVDSGRAAGPNIDLFSLEKISLQSPRLKTPPSSPELLITKKTRARHRIIEGFHKPFQTEKENKVLRKSTSPIRKATCPAKMRRAQHGDENVHSWGQQLASDASSFDFGFQTTPMSPPPSGQVSESSENNNQTISATQGRSGNYAWDRPISEQYAYRTTQDIESPFTTPPADMTTFPQSNIRNASTNNMMFSTSRRDQSSTQWIQNPTNSDYTFQTSTPYFEEPGSPIWWEDAATTPLVEPAPSAYSRPNQQNSQSLAMQLQAELVYNANELALGPSNMASGLMIQMPNTPNRQSFVVDASPMDSEQGYFAPAAASSALQPHHAHRYPHTQPHHYAPLPTRTDKSHQSHSHSHSHSHSQSHSHSRPETTFPKAPSPHARTSSTNVVSKKSHRSGGNSSSTSSRSRSSSKREHGHGHGQSPRTPRGPTPAAAAVAAGDFVNFTPKDSNRILTGVAPSGSSKTKARREKEAAEKTRRLSQAAVRAVREAGGSIDTLVEEGLFEREGLMEEEDEEEEQEE